MTKRGCPQSIMFSVMERCNSLLPLRKGGRQWALTKLETGGLVTFSASLRSELLWVFPRGDRSSSDWVLVGFPQVCALQAECLRTACPWEGRMLYHTLC